MHKIVGMKIAFLLIVFLTFASLGFATEPSPGVFPLHISEHFDRSGLQFEACAVVLETANGQSLIRTDLRLEQRWHRYGGGPKDEGRQEGDVWTFEKIGLDGREITTITFDPMTGEVTRATIQKNDFFGQVLLRYVCIRPATA